jgi:diguanylate cyclase (GGDEF)-like protein
LTTQHHSEDQAPVEHLLARRAGSWLCPTEVDRARLTANSRRVRNARLVVCAVVAISLLYYAPRLGWWSVALFALVLPATATTDWRVARTHRPEYQVLLTLLWVQVVTGAAVALSGGPSSPILFLIVIPAVFSAARFRHDVVIAAAGFAAVVLLGVTFGVNAAATIAQPGPLITTLALLIASTAIVVALGDAEAEQRGESILDPLTGLLNRSGLARRFEEIAGQARLSNAPVSMLLCDIDHFKMVNDLEGHDQGDQVLRELAQELRRQMRSFELIYRIGGEEFLVLLPGAAARQATVLAERLRLAVEQRRPAGMDVTVSVGVSTARGEGARFTPMFKAADDALYAAKHAGRNRVIAGRDRHIARGRRFAATPVEVAPQPGV